MIDWSQEVNRAKAISTWIIVTYGGSVLSGYGIYKLTRFFTCHLTKLVQPYRGQTLESLRMMADQGTITLGQAETLSELSGPPIFSIACALIGGFLILLFIKKLFEGES